MSLDAKIGVWTLGVALMMLLFNSFQKSGLIEFGEEIGLLFTQVHGLRAGDPVTIGGVLAGRVVEIDFAAQEIQEAFIPITGGTELVRASVHLDGRRRITKESTYAVRTNLNGRRWLDITLAPGLDTVGPHDHFFAEEAVGQEDQLQRTLTTFSTLSAQTEQLREQLTDPDFLIRTKDTISNLRFYSREMSHASAKTPELLAQLEGNLDSQEYAMYQQLRAFDEKIAEVSRRMTEMGPQLSENIRGWTARVERNSERLTNTLEMASARSLEYQQLLDEALERHLDEESLETLINQARRWARDIQEYRYLAEDIHSLTSDPTVRADLTQAIKKIRVRGDELNERLRKLEELLEVHPATKSLGGEKKPQ